MDDFSDRKGSPVKTLEVTYPDLKRIKTVVWAIPCGSILISAMLIYFALVEADVPDYQATYILMMVFFLVLDLMTYLFLHSLLGRNWERVVFYQNGVQFPEYLWERLKGRNSFLQKDDIISVTAVFITVEGLKGSNTATLIFKTNAGKVYQSGYRINPDIISVSDWIESEWKIKVERIDLRGNPVTNLEKPVASLHGDLRTCVGCGHPFTDELGFCPSCGKTVPKGEGPTDPFAQGGLGPKTQEPVGPPPAQSFPYQPPPVQYPLPPVPGQNYPPAQNQFGPGVPPYQYDPRYQAPYSGQGYPPPQFPAPYYQYPQNPEFKNPRTARLLAALGFLGILGVGHFYMGKYVKATILFFVGGFLALFSLASMISIPSMVEYPIEVRLTAIAISTVPFLIIQLWQMYDAPRPKEPRYADHPPGNWPPRYGPR